ncbi:flavin-containing monooxygenase [Actinopolymorpha alba]|uniref:flavin-containing monooxygenase n=1 Tax=Actinopolymorpha alba TaxID=533267 RepID=UPI00058BE4DF|nr:NAD(P)/FAD-dependent oxidoreductase [Actinopolymorpha alba]
MNTSIDPVVIVGGGQSGLAAARAVGDAGLRPLVLESGPRPVGSWPSYYDSLTLFSPAAYSAYPGVAFGGDPDRYPSRDEVVAYLERYATGLDVEIRTNTRVETVEPYGPGFLVQTVDGERIAAAGVVAATGSFSNPHLPTLPGREGFAGEVLHVADYRNPKPYVGRRVVVVGGGNSAVQVGYELAEVATVTLATRAPLTFLPQRHGGKDLHYWLTSLGFDDLPPAWLARIVGGTLVLDTGRYRDALESGRFDRRPMFTAFAGDDVVWADGGREQVDVVVFATGYRPSLGYLRALGALDQEGTPLHAGGVSLTYPGLVYAGLEFQRSFSSNTLRGVSRDAEYVLGPLAAHVRGAPAAVGL